MKINASRRFRYRVINFIAGSQSPTKAALLRAGILLTLLGLLVPFRVGREIAYGPVSGSRDLKSALRMMLWLWNRSWIPIRHPLVTYFDIGWRLSESSCRTLCTKGFLNRDSLKRRCDLAQYGLAELRLGVESSDPVKTAEADAKICRLVGGVLTDARQWALTQPDSVDSSTKTSTTVSNIALQEAGEFDNQATRAALLEFDELCRDLGQAYFLVSGTFLGVVRDGTFIGHDNDIDVGVFEDGLLPTLLPALQASRKFVIVKVDRICRRFIEDGLATYRFMDDPAIIKVVHRSGVAIDIFNHFYEGELAWHGTSYHRWDNKRFRLKNYEFLGREFKAAEDYDLYLTENYGDSWRVPQPDFDSSVDTPNLSFVGSANGLVFFAWTIARFVTTGEPARALKYIDMLVRLGACRIEDDQVRVV